MMIKASIDWQDSGHVFKTCRPKSSMDFTGCSSIAAIATTGVVRGDGKFGGFSTFGLLQSARGGCVLLGKSCCSGCRQVAGWGLQEPAPPIPRISSFPCI